jgi:hypothetical protein
VKDDDGYIDKWIIETRETKKHPWKNVFESPALKKVIIKKHFLIIFAIRHLGYGSEFLKRRKKRMNFGKI